MIDFIKENINWIKDFATLIFVGTATVIGVLTYLRARATILQPIRTEVIKKQSELLSRLLKFLKEKNQSFETGIDYVKVVQVNVLKTLKDYGFIFKEQDQIFEKLEKEVVGWIPCGKSEILHDVEIIGTFDTKGKINNPRNLGKEKFENLKNGEIDIDKIFQTRTLTKFMSQLTDFSDDPFMPSLIKSTLDELSNNVYINLNKILKLELEKFMIEFSKEYFKKGIAPKFDPIGVYNSFNHERIHHRKSMIKLKNEIRKYLMIDEPW